MAWGTSPNPCTYMNTDEKKVERGQCLCGLTEEEEWGRGEGDHIGTLHSLVMRSEGEERLLSKG